MTGNPLHIGIDGYNLAMPNGTGIATYGRTLAQVLQGAGHQVDGVFGIDAGRDPALRETLFFDRLEGAPQPPNRKQARRADRALRRWAMLPWVSPMADAVPLTDAVERAAFADRLPAFDRIVTTPRLFDLAHRHFALWGRFLPLRMARSPQVMHWTYPLPIRLVGARNIYTLHDLVPLKLPYTTLDAKAAYRKLAQRCVAEGDRVCTVSEASKADIVALLGADPAKVVNTWQAAPMPEDIWVRDPAADAAEIAGIFGLKRHGYFLYLGAIEPKKNLGRLIEAYLSLDSETPLVIVGGRSWRSESELILLPPESEVDSAHGRRMAERIIRLEHLPRGLLLKLVRGAKAVAFPSIYEGFGLPVLEAMQLGTPVLTANTSSLPEVAGDAAVQIDPYDTAAIAAGLRALDGDAALRARLSAAGPVQARTFSATAYLERLEGLYRGVLGQGA